MIFTCPHCYKELNASLISNEGMPHGQLEACSCKESRDAWEAEHRATMERRKNAQRDTQRRNRSLLNVGRTTYKKDRRR